MNAKLEAEIVNLRTELFTTSATAITHKEEAEKLVLQLHQEKVKIQNFPFIMTQNITTVILVTIHL